jgi:Tol biopolymer transport system component
LRVFPLAGNAGLETSPAISPDGKQVAYSWDGNRKNFDIYVKSIEGGTPHRLTDNAAHDIDPAWSPDGHQIAFLRVFPAKTEVLAVPSVGGVEKLIGAVPRSINRWHPEEPEQNGAGGPVWSPDGSS